MKTKRASKSGRNTSGRLSNEREWLDAIESRTAFVGVVGMGYVGLPLMRTFCEAGFSCLGYDIDESKVDKLNAGKSYIKHVPDADIKRVIRDGH